MDFNEWGSFEDLLRACGYTNSNNNNNNNNNNDANNNNGANNNDANNNTTANNNTNNPGCHDIPNGFQTVPPDLFVIIGAILGNITAGSVPFNVQTAIGDWLILVGQAIITFNSQQLYFQSGPGRYFNPKNFNIDNPFCGTSSTNTTSNTSSTSNTSNSSNTSTSSKASNSKANDIETNKIQELEKQVQELTNEINKIKILLQK